MADLIHLSPGVGVDDAIVILNRVILAEVLIVAGPARPDRLWVRGGRGEIQALLIVNNRARVAVDTIPCVPCPLVAAIHRSGSSQAVAGNRGDARNAESAVQIFPLDTGIAAPSIP